MVVGGRNMIGMLGNLGVMGLCLNLSHILSSICVMDGFDSDFQTLVQSCQYVWDGSSYASLAEEEDYSECLLQVECSEFTSDQS